jgi:tetraacyldisaccharide 4'-kinase
LLPFSWLYGLITLFRNFLYDSGILKSYSFTPAVICVGNLNVGGTGKTPMIEYLARLLSAKWEVAILSRGYKRKSIGFRLAQAADNASTLGDEPFQFYKKMNGRAIVAVCSDRVLGIQEILKIKPSVQVILLDDAFQHRRVNPTFSILLTELANPFYNDFILPAGRLREERKSARRANLLVVTKCHSLSEEIQKEVSTRLSIYKKPVYFSKISYQEPVSFTGSAKIGNEITLVTGIANPKPLLQQLSAKYTIQKHFSFTDHYAFKVNDIKMIQKESTTSILTTEKDFVRLISHENKNLLDQPRWFYLPIETDFINTGSEFDNQITHAIEEHLKNNGN